LQSTLVDFLLILIGVIAVFRGWRSGLLKSAFSLIGFIGGGLGGLVAGTKYLDNVTNIFGKFALYLLFISIGSTIGDMIMSKIGQLFHDKVMFAPIKWLDSILGSVFELLKSAIIIYLLFTLLTATHWSLPSKYINESKIYGYAKTVVPPFIKSEAAKLKF
jgi:uncharacterized membrane protein required for colicin V production